METLTPVLDVVNDHPYLSLTSVILGCAALVRLARWRSRSNLPPGPKGFPIVGNLFDLASTHAWEQFGAWGKQYGGSSFLHILLPHIIRTLTWMYTNWIFCASRGRHIRQCSGSGHDNTQLIQGRRRAP